MVLLVAAFLPFAAPVVELAVDDADGLPRCPVAPVRVDRAFSAQLLKRLVALICFTGDFNRSVASSGGGRGRTLSAFAFGVARGRGRMLADDGDKALEFLATPASCLMVGLLRTFFFAIIGCSSGGSLVVVELLSLSLLI